MVELLALQEKGRQVMKGCTLRPMLEPKEEVEVSLVEKCACGAVSAPHASHAQFLELEGK